MNKTHESVAAVVVTFNSADLIVDLVASLQPGMAGVPWQLIFADNASTDDTVATLARIAPDATVVEMGRNAGYAAGINAAVAAAPPHTACLLYTSDAADDLLCVDLGGRRIIKK